MQPLTYFNKERKREEELTALDLRVLMCIGWHDRLSKAKGSKGCYASNAVMALECGCTITSISRAISHLVAAGLIERDHDGVPGKRHLTVYRVRYDNSDAKMLAQLGKDQLPNGTNDEALPTPKSFVRAGADEGKTLVRGHEENDAITTTSFSQEISLSEGIDSEESVGKNSSQEALFAEREWVLDFNSNLSEEANLARCERGLKNGTPMDLVRWYAYLLVIIEFREDLRAQASRLSDDVAGMMTNEQVREAWCKAHKAIPEMRSNVVAFRAKGGKGGSE